MKKEKDLTKSKIYGNIEGAFLGLILFSVIIWLGVTIGISVESDLQNDKDRVIDYLVSTYGLVEFLADIIVLFIVIALLIIIGYVHEKGHYKAYKKILPIDEQAEVRITMQGFQPCTIVGPNLIKPKDKIKALLSPLVPPVIVVLIALPIRNALFLCIGAAGVALCGEDILCALRVFRYRKLKNAYCVDHPERMGCILFYEEDEEEETDEDEEKDEKKSR